MQYQVELVWNREFNFVPHHDPFICIEDAVRYAQFMEQIGDGAAVKKTRVVDSENRVVWAYGKFIDSPAS